MPARKTLKRVADILRESADGNTCCVCGASVTVFTGTGSQVLCEEHQDNLYVNGGTGRMDRPHTFHRKTCCDWCGYDPLKNPALAGITDPEELTRVRNASLVGDHIIRRSDGGDDSEQNIQTLCRNCDAIKTMLNKDYLPGVQNKQ